MLDSNSVESASPFRDAAADGVRAVRAPRFHGDHVAALYLEHRPLLMYIGARKFGLPEGDAEALIQEVFVSLIQAGTAVENVRSWLVAAMCNASRYYLRTRGRTQTLPEDVHEHSDPGSSGLAEQFALRITLRQALGYLQPRCRETLRLHYYEGCSAPEIARELETTHRYAEKLIHKCLKRVREIYQTITAVAR